MCGVLVSACGGAGLRGRVHDAVSCVRLRDLSLHTSPVPPPGPAPRRCVVFTGIARVVMLCWSVCAYTQCVLSVLINYTRVV